ncbi:mucin-3A-like isoform X2 [Struthio camelus]|uniref:mucin-3A-like isoform X2 n=1 Tax=Struthio camelus TaxID=8801 RepID=UPI003603FB24
MKMKLGCCFFTILFFVPLKATSASCENGGTAVGEGCACPPGFNGTRCEIQDSSKACQNGGTAVGTKCYCPPGFKGALCQLPDEASACQNGATAFGMECVCPLGYWGPLCQYKEQPSSCLNGGTLLGTGCRCPPTFWGPRCECKYPDSPLTPTVPGSQNVTTRKNISSPVSDTTLSPPLNTSETNSTMPTSERSPANTMGQLTVSPTNASASEMTAQPYRTSTAPTASGNTTVTCSGNCTTPGGTHNDTVEVPQHPPNSTHLITTVSPVSKLTHTTEMPQHPPNGTHPIVTARPVSEPNATVNVSWATPTGASAGNASVSAVTIPPPNITTTPMLFRSTTSQPLSSLCPYLPPWHLNGSSPTPVVCHNGGVANLTKCLCLPGFSGPSCETVDDTDRCHNGSTAVGNRCICPPGLSGPRCDTYDNTTACQNGATAVGTECYCPSGYYGPRCEFYNASTTEIPVTHPSTTRPKSTPKAPVATSKSTVSTRSTTTSRTTPKPTTKSTTTAKTTTTTTTTTPVPTTADPCQNGGLWTGTVCLCPPNIDGSHCQFAASTINITAELGPSVTMMARVTNRVFSEAMGNSSSAAYRSFAEEFGQTIDQMYQNVSGYRGARILNLTKGSVVVNYKVFLHPPTEANPNISLDHKSQELLEMMKSRAQPQDCSHTAKLCFSASSSKVTLTETAKLNATELCKKYTPANFSQFYYPYWTRHSLLCVTNCTLNVPGTINCNSGLCRVTLEGPRCFCPDIPWYLTSGNRCETHISKLGLGLGVGLGLGLTILILLILCLILTICLAQGKGKFAKASETGDDSSWPGNRSNSHATGIYHVNGRGSAPWKASNTRSAYKPNAEVAALSMPMQPQAEVAASL